MYTSTSGSLWLCLHWHLRENQESSLYMTLSATPNSHALVHTTKQSCNMQIGLLLGESEPENFFYEGTSYTKGRTNHSGPDIR